MTNSNLSPAKKALLQKWQKGQSKVKSIPKRLNSDIAPLSFSQQRLWFIDQLYNDSSFYNILGGLHLQGILNIKAFRQSLNEIIKRHESWRTIFSTKDEQPIQIILPELNWELPIINIEHLAGGNWEAEVQKLAIAEAKNPFNLTTGPLVRATLLRLSETEHIFLLNMHHIVSDGWSIGVFAKELATLYASFSQGQSSPLPELATQYGDFAIWERERLKDKLLKTNLDYWKQKLKGELPILRLPTDRPRPSTPSFVGKKHFFKFSKDLTDASNKFASQEEVSLFMLLLAGFNVLLNRYTEQEDILVGTPVANRNRPELEKMLGFFVNTLVIRNDLSENPSFRKLVHKVREVTLEAYAHQDLPFDKLVEELRPQRDVKLNPLFQVMFILQNTPMPAQEVLGLTLQSVEVDNGTAMFDILLSITESEQGLNGFLEYNTDLFDSETISQFISNYQTLLENILINPDENISKLPLLNTKEQQKLLVEWNDTEKDFSHVCLHQLFEQQVKRSPHTTALIEESQQVTYEQLNQKANQLAHYLQKIGVTTETIVAICLERSVEMVVGVLAVLKVGATYLPLDPHYPSNRLAFMLSDSQAPFILTSQKILEKLPLLADKTKTIYWDLNKYIIAQESTDNPLNEVKAEHLAYILYTSGSTGNPKGVQGTHLGTVNGLNWLWESYPPQENEVFCHKTAISFGDSIWEIFAPLLKGFPAVIIPDPIVKDTRLFLETLAHHKVTRIILVPSLLRVIQDSYKHLFERLEHLKIWMTSGEPLTLDLQQTFYELLPSAKLLNFYGLSEVSANAICYDTSLLPEKATSVFIGKPIHNAQVYVLDRYLQPLPMGVWGELYISGVPIARGYLNNPSLNKEQFINHPFLPEVKLFKTGDIVRYRNDGNLEYLGRRDRQVKIRGFRIELGEIEGLLTKHPRIKESVVIASGDSNNEQRLVAYIVTDTNKSITIPQVRSYLQEHLPDYMIPTAFAVLDKMPLTSSGKIDKRSLPTENLILPQSGKSFTAPRDTWEFALVQIWENLLGVSPISIKDNFFDLGGHSLLAARLMAQINEKFGQNITLSALFQGATVENLAKILQQQIGYGSGSPLVAIRSSGTKTPFFCVHPAGGTIFTFPNLANQLDAEQPFYAFEQIPREDEPSVISIQEMANQYLQEIYKVQPNGPYLLGGWCYGGLVAFEMAQQLIQQGQKVAFLAIFDAIIPETRIEPKADDDTKFIVRLTEFIKHLFNIDLSLSYHELLKLPLDEQHQVLMKKLNIASDAEIQQHLRGFKLFKAHAQAMRNYEPQVYPHEITLFRASEQIPHDFQSPELYSDDPLLGWGKYSEQPIKLFDVPGNHFSMFSEPNIKKLGDKLRSNIIKISL
ncbi:amino acid adenylation domain-containing protein [Calothrix parasitica NIES-267]|uniref:Amino acid adenylation domain-containing protein n=1 Tax=Calothrix parasitica NIES-267 TaxID=1973488 RepID=A0A1Z4LT61_9CYAN|nr:amino acid adenylation domain-containing protein [Calothrix parasitica NIES-267]